MLLGYNGMQHTNYTTDQNDWTRPKNPGGGGFATTVFKLQYLYELYTLKKCIWTFPNINYDLCRYTGCKFTFFRHPWHDFVLNYQLMYPMSLDFPAYMECQPLRMLLQQKKIVITSLKHRPGGKLYVTKKFRPPKQMVNKWFFQDMFSNKPLILFRAAVCDLFQPDLGPSGGNKLISLKCLNIHNFYIQSNWGTASAEGYLPVATWAHDLIIKNANGTEHQISAKGVTYSGGWFQKQILQAYQVKKPGTGTAYQPIYTARYNPSQDTGIGNTVYLCSIHTENYSIPKTDTVLVARNKPLWMLLFGFQDYVVYLKKPAETLKIYFLVIVSDFIEPHAGAAYPKTHVIIDDSFVQGKGPFNTTVPDSDINLWYPTLNYQQECMANIVKTGPFVPKPDPTKANWELHYKCTFYFKWGGSLQNYTEITNPADKKEYPVPDNLQSAIQVTDPQHQTPETILHNWDFRRGYITKTALKRMSKYLETKSIVSTDSDSQPPQKKKKFSQCMPTLQDQETKEISCLHSLFEENTCQEQEAQTETSLRHLIQQQQQQQQSIKLKLLQLITHMKRAQQQLQLQTGILE